MKKLTSLLLLVVLAGNVVPALASSYVEQKTTDLSVTSNESEEMKQFDLSKYSKNRGNAKTSRFYGTEVNETEVVDKEEIAQLAEELNIENVDSISSITVGIIEDLKVKEAEVGERVLSFLDTSVPAYAASYSIKSPTYEGSNYYYSNEEVRDTLVNSSKSSAKLSKKVSVTGTVNFTCSVEATIKSVVKAQCGMEIGQSKTGETTVETDVPGRSTISILSYPYYAKYSYNVYDGTSYYTSGKYLYPTGGVYFIIR